MAKHEIPYFLRDFRGAIVAFPSIAIYAGFLPTMKLVGAFEISWLWAFAPVWIPFLAFWITIGFVAFLALVGEIGFLLLPDKNFLNGVDSNTEKR